MIALLAVETFLGLAQVSLSFHCFCVIIIQFIISVSVIFPCHFHIVHCYFSIKSWRRSNKSHQKTMSMKITQDTRDHLEGMDHNNNGCSILSLYPYYSKLYIIQWTPFKSTPLRSILTQLNNFSHGPKQYRV